jgi:hypothetical protein
MLLQMSSSSEQVIQILDSLVKNPELAKKIFDKLAKPIKEQN